MLTPSSNSPIESKAPVLERFVETLNPEEKLLVEKYLELPKPQTLSKNFDKIVETNPHEDKIN